MKRRLVYCRQFHPSSVVLLYEIGASAASWSVRKYATPGAVSLRYASDFAQSLAELSTTFEYAADAPPISTSDLNFWHGLTLETNARLQLVPSVLSAEKLASTDDNQPGAFEFPLLDRSTLMALPKARKASDMQRILHAPQSEDWVTWNAFALLQTYAADRWWESLVALANQDEALDLPEGWAATPTVPFGAPYRRHGCTKRQVAAECETRDMPVLSRAAMQLGR